MRPFTGKTFRLGGALVLSLAVAAALAACSKKHETQDEEAFDAGDVDAGLAIDAGPIDASRDTRAEDERDAWAMGRFLCGDAGQPECPMQGWMKHHATPLLGFGDLSGIGDVFDDIGRLVPPDPLFDGGPSFDHWRSIARDGAAAARAGDIPAAKAACRGCHVQYLKTYQREMRARPLGDAAP